MRRLSPIALFVLAGCLDVAQPPDDLSFSQPLTVANVNVGTLDLVVNDVSGFPSDVIAYRNTTSRTLSRIGIAVVPQGADLQSPCRAPFPIFRDAEFSGLPPTARRDIARGIVPRSVQVFITSADTGTGNFAPAVAGRWGLTVQMFRTRSDTVVVEEDLLEAVSNETGAVVASKPGVDSTVMTGRLVPGAFSSLRYYPGRCAAEWTTIAALSVTERRGDTITVRGRADQALTAEEAAPDSFAMRFVRRPPVAP